MSETYGIRHGVLYTTNPRNLVPWGAHVNPVNAYDQNYGQFVMVTVPEDDDGPFAGQSWMIDTYHFKDKSLPAGYEGNRHDGYIKKAAERDFVTSSAIWSYKGDCYYNACVQLTEDNAHLFEERLELSEWCYVDDETAKDYAEDDVRTKLKLFREHGFHWHFGDCGISVRRKSAEKSAVCQARAIRSRFRNERPYYGSYVREADDLERFAFEHRDNEEVVRIYEEEEEEIAFGRRVAAKYRKMRCARFPSFPGQGRLFDIDEEGNIVVTTPDED